jgi:hypothetical protein
MAQTTLESSIAAAIRLKPKMVTIGEVSKLSRRKAKKLAYLYRGSRRGLWYKRYLEGDTKDFMVINNRLIRFRLLTGKTVLHTYHSADVVTLLQNALSEHGESKPNALIETPAEVKFCK